MHPLECPESKRQTTRVGEDVVTGSLAGAGAATSLTVLQRWPTTKRTTPSQPTTQQLQAGVYAREK